MLSQAGEGAWSDGGLGTWNHNDGSGEWGWGWKEMEWMVDVWTHIGVLGGGSGGPFPLFRFQEERNFWMNNSLQPWYDGVSMCFSPFRNLVCSKTSHHESLCSAMICWMLFLLLAPLCLTSGCLGLGKGLMWNKAGQLEFPSPLR